MITEAAVLLREEVQRYLNRDRESGEEVEVLLGNVAALDENPKLADKVLLTLVNVEEESTLKNGNWSIRNPVSGGVEVTNPAVYLNLYLLFSATMKQQATDPDYQKALGRIAGIIELFQSKKEFTIRNSPGFNSNNLVPRHLEQLRLHPELYTLTFEQINHLWGALGGKQSPSVMYKVRLVKIQGLLTEEAPLIQTIQSTAKPEMMSPAAR